MKIVKIMILVACLGGVKGICGAEYTELGMQPVLQSLSPEAYRAIQAWLPSMSIEEAYKLIEKLFEQVPFEVSARDRISKFIHNKTLSLQEAKDIITSFVSLPHDYQFTPDFADASRAKTFFLTKLAPKNLFQGVADAARAAQQYRLDMLKKYGPYAAAAVLALGTGAYAAHQAGYLDPIKQRISDWWWPKGKEEEIISVSSPTFEPESSVQPQSLRWYNRFGLNPSGWNLNPMNWSVPSWRPWNR